MIIDQAIYNGDFIHKRFAYQYFKKDVSPYGNIVSFRAPMFVNDNLIDLDQEIVDQAEDTLTIINKVIDGIPDIKDTKILKSIIKELYLEALNVEQNT